MNQLQKQYLNEFLFSLSKEERCQYKSFSADYFCADRESANTCLELILKGEKTATCSMKYWYDSGLLPMPRKRHIQVVTDWDGCPKCIIETTDVSECKFSEVTLAFATAEGEGDKSLDYWRKTHWDFFSKECDEQGLTLSESTTLILERFNMVYV